MEFRPAVQRDQEDRPAESQDAHLDRSLRPAQLEGFIGQERVVDNLKVASQA
jgi:Holliday junction resolvasome RuvABC ATP-dependent DNA helicase subunit